METKPDSSKDWKGFFLKFQKESPRAAAILGVAFLDVQLRQLISNLLIDETNVVDELLGNDKKIDRPLSSFSSRIRAAYCLGLISKDEYEDLNIIRKIRNRFAHRLHDLSFDDHEIVSWCKTLRIPKELLKAVDWPQSPKNLFLVCVSTLATRIPLRALKIAKERRAVPRGFELAEVVKATNES